jgi:hypothetical protein
MQAHRIEWCVDQEMAIARAEPKLTPALVIWTRVEESLISGMRDEGVETGNGVTREEG